MPRDLPPARRRDGLRNCDDTQRRAKTMPTQYDAVIIGTGQSGPPLAGRLTGAGMRVAIVERKRFGGTCVNNGCIPTKTLVASAKAIQMARRGAEFGFRSGPVTVDMKEVKARKDRIVANNTQSVESWVRKMQNATVYQGHARFESPRTVRVGDEVLEAGKIFIDVGGRAAKPAVHGLESVEFLNNSSMMDVDFLPPHLVILGGSYIGLEFGQMYRRFGSEVTIIERSERLLSREDPGICDAVRQIVEGEGIHVVTSAEVRQVEKQAGQIAVKLSING